MWNSIILTPPPTNTFKAKKIAIDLKAVTLILQNAMDTLKSQKILYAESPILSTCVYRMKLSFRHDKGFKFMEKTNKILKLLTHFNLVHDLTAFLDTMPKRYEKDLYLPTKQMLEYVLMRMQGYVKLLCRIVESCVATVKYMKWRLHLGHLWATTVVVIGIVSRVWFLCKYFTQECCQWYNDLLPLRDKLDIYGVPWLETGYEFPEDLKHWLDVDWLSDEPDVVLKPRFDLPVYSLMDESDDEDVKFCGEYKLNDYFVIDDDKADDTDVEFVTNYKSKIQLARTINISESDSDVEVLISSLNTEYVEDDASEEEMVTNAAQRKRKRNGKIVRNIGGTNEDIGEPIIRQNNVPPAHNNMSALGKGNNNAGTSTNGAGNKKKRKKNVAANKKGNQSPQAHINIGNLADLNTFLNNENTSRERNLKKCVTRNLKNNEWNALFNKLQTLRMKAVKKQKLGKRLLKNARKMISSLK